MKGIIETLASVTERFDRIGIAYAVMGGIAVRAFAIPRATYDIDLTITLNRERLPQVFESLRDIDFAIPEVYESGWVDMIAGMPLIKLKRYFESETLDVDIFLAESEFQKEVMKRRFEVDAQGLRIWAVSPEDLILFKLVAGRPRDLVDVADVLFMQGTLDEAYMRRWAIVLGIQPQLEEALNDKQ
jgi:predicted nucleotidyltransferase